MEILGFYQFELDRNEAISRVDLDLTEPLLFFVLFYMILPSNR